MRFPRKIHKERCEANCTGLLSLASRPTAPAAHPFPPTEYLRSPTSARGSDQREIWTQDDLRAVGLWLPRGPRAMSDSTALRG